MLAKESTQFTHTVVQIHPPPLYGDFMSTISLYRVDFESDTTFDEMLEKLGVSESDFSGITEVRLNVEHFSTK